MTELPGPATAGVKPKVSGRRFAVSAEHPLATLVGQQILRAGGSATDAVVAMAAVEQVVMPGTTSLGGAVGGVRWAPGAGTTAINAGMQTVAHRDGPYVHERDRETGRAVLVPGALTGLEAMWRRWGQLDWDDLWAPAIHLAEDGFPLYELYRLNMERRRDVLTRYPQGRAAYLPGGTIPVDGQRFRQPVLARTLTQVAKDGAGYFYRGPWGQHLVDQVQRLGGTMTLEDLAGYEVRFEEPLIGHYLDFELHTVVPPLYGGAMTLAVLGIAEALGLHKKPPRSTSGATLAEEINTVLVVAPDPFLLDLADTDPASDACQRFQQALSPSRTRALADSVRAGDIGNWQRQPGTHSHSLAATDARGEVVIITYTIESDSWGDTGIVVDGVALNSSAFETIPWDPGPKRRIAEPFSTYLAFRDGQWALAGGAIGSGLIPCQLQMTLDVLGRGVDAHRAVSHSRFGGREADFVTMTEGERILVEEFSPTVKEEAEATGLHLATAEQLWLGHAYGDPGYWAGIQRDAQGLLTPVTDPRLPGACAAQ